MENKEQLPSTEKIAQWNERDTFKGPSPKWAGITNALAYVSWGLPVTWASFGAMDMVFDKLLRGVDLGKNTLTRLFPLKGFTLPIVGGVVAYQAYQEGKKEYNEALVAEKQYDKLYIEHSLYRDQLVEAGITPNDIISSRKVAYTDADLKPVSQKPAKTVQASGIETEKLAADHTAALTK